MKVSGLELNVFGLESNLQAATACLRFVAVLCRLVDKEEYHAGIRATWMAFTVNQWDKICSVTFWWSVFIHTVLVIGGYQMPEAREEMDVLVEFGDEGGDSSVENSFIFQFGILAYTNLAATYLGYVYLILVALRGLSYFRAEAPIIMMEAVLAEEGEAKQISGAEPEELDVRTLFVCVKSARSGGHIFASVVNMSDLEEACVHSYPCSCFCLLLVHYLFQSENHLSVAMRTMVHVSPTSSFSQDPGHKIIYLSL